MLLCVKEYEAIKRRESKVFKTVKAFCEYHKFSHQNFMKVYHRYKENPVIESLYMQKRGPKYKTNRTFPEIEEKVVALRENGENRYAIARALAQNENINISPSTVYNICARHGLNCLTEEQRAERRRIITEKAGELAHSDLHQLPKGLVLSKPNESFYVLGVMDDCTRCVWLILLEDKKAQSVMFATLKALGVLDLLYGIKFKAMMTDNGAEIRG